jgi:transposase-like protein
LKEPTKCYDGWHYFLQHLNIACPLIATNHPLEAHKRHGYFTFISDRDKGLVQALKDVFPKNHTTQCSIHIQRNVAAKFSNKVAADICNISKTFSVYQENNMLDNIKESSKLAYDYLVGDNGIEPSKWRSTEWMKDRTLPPRYGIVSTNISESSNSMYEDASNLP